jgi:hypothetical protein
MPRLKCLSALVSSKVSDRDFGLTNAAAAISLLKTIGAFRWQFSHIRRPAKQEGRLAAEIGAFWTCSMRRDDARPEGKADVPVIMPDFRNDPSTIAQCRLARSCFSSLSL